MYFYNWCDFLSPSLTKYHLEKEWKGGGEGEGRRKKGRARGKKRGRRGEAEAEKEEEKEEVGMGMEGKRKKVGERKRRWRKERREWGEGGDTGECKEKGKEDRGGGGRGRADYGKNYKFKVCNWTVIARSTPRAMPQQTLQCEWQGQQDHRLQWPGTRQRTASGWFSYPLGWLCKSPGILPGAQERFGRPRISMV